MCHKSKTNLFLVNKVSFFLRRRTTTAQKDPSQLINELVAFVIHMRRLNIKDDFNPSNIIAMDETPVWADMVSSTTVNKTGQKEVMLKTTGHEKVRVSVCLAAEADGSKLKPFIVFAGAKRESAALNKDFGSKCVVASSANGWMNEQLTIQWCKEVVGSFSFRKRLLVWDTFEAHLTEEVKCTLKDMKVESALVPGGCTKYIQAPDVYWNKPFKGYITEMYDEWLANGVHQFTEAGNMKSAPRRLVVEWILKAWQMLEKDLIVNSFHGCAVNLKSDGSEDDKIHCFKEKGTCAAGAALLKDQTTLLHDKELEKDPFNDPTESDIEEANIELNLLDEDEDDEFVSVD